MASNKIGTGAAALGLLAAASSPTLAESADKAPSAAVQLASYTVEQVDCVTHVKNQRSIRKEAGDPMSRKEMKLMLGECRNANADVRLYAQEEIIAVQEQRIAELDQKLASLELEIDTNAQILDERGRIIGRLISVQGQLEIQRATLVELEAENARINANIDVKKGSIAATNQRIEALKADTQAKLDQAEAILRALVV